MAARAAAGRAARPAEQPLPSSPPPRRRDLGVGGAAYQLLAPGAGGGPLRLQELDAAPVATAVAGPVLQRDADSGELRPLYSIQLSAKDGTPAAVGRLDASGRMHGSWVAFTTLGRLPMALTYRRGLLHGRQDLALDGLPAVLPLAPALPEADVTLASALLSARCMRVSGAWEQGHPVHVITASPATKAVLGKSDQILLHYTKGSRFAHGAGELDDGPAGSAPSELAAVTFWSPAARKRLQLGVTPSGGVADADIHAAVALSPNPASCLLGVHLSGDGCEEGVLPLRLSLRGGALLSARASAGSEGGVRVFWGRQLGLQECARGLRDASIGRAWRVMAVRRGSPAVSGSCRLGCYLPAACRLLLTLTRACPPIAPRRHCSRLASSTTRRSWTWQPARAAGCSRSSSSPARP